MTEPCKTVPVEPTHKLVPFAATLEMEAAARKFVAPYHDLQDYEVSAKVPKDLFRLAWTAMIAAAPEPPRVSVEEVERLCKRLDERMVGVGCNLGIIDTTTPDPDCAEAAAMIRRLALVDMLPGTSSDAQSARPDGGEG